CIYCFFLHPARRMRDLHSFPTRRSSDLLLTPPKEHKQVAVDSKLFDGYIGRYQLAPDFIITITRDGERLFKQASDQPKFEIFPEDRKSTRLNSSHLGISYAVFCLKKKKP